jgi:hypothetical protein
MRRVRARKCRRDIRLEIVSGVKDRAARATRACNKTSGIVMLQNDSGHSAGAPRFGLQMGGK